MIKRVYVCNTLGALADEPGHLCNPKSNVEVCPYCREKILIAAIIARAKWRTSSMSAINAAACPPTLMYYVLLKMFPLRNNCSIVELRRCGERLPPS
jgi:hypothetical protein